LLADTGIADRTFSKHHKSAAVHKPVLLVEGEPAGHLSATPLAFHIALDPKVLKIRHGHTPMFSLKPVLPFATPSAIANRARYSVSDQFFSAKLI
jgi:hypothetical protein